jgi:hypothetical protein
MPFAKTTRSGLSSAASTTIDWPYLDPSHIKATKGGTTFDLSTSTIKRDRTTGVTTITFASAQSGNFVFWRETPIAAALDGNKSTADGQYASSLVQGLAPINEPLLYLLQEMDDMRKDHEARIVVLET